MKLSTALVAATLALSSAVYAADATNPAEPPATPAGGAPQAGLATSTIVGGAIGLAVVVAVATSDNNDNNTATASGTF